MEYGKYIAMYVRLSEEDRNVDGFAKVESDSIANQRKLITSYIKNQPEFDSYPVREYCDDGHTGTDFKREGFIKLIEDVKNGLIGCIIVKDFSRFGRDYLEVGNYLEFIFPSLQVRFISINDGYDSKQFGGMTGGMNVAMKNLIYNMYSTDMSKKTKSALVTKHKSGQCVSPFAKFGYKKSEEDKHKLVIDEEAAIIVRRIFAMALDGMTATAIAKQLNREQVPTVGEYKERHSGFKMGSDVKKRMWETSSIRDIIHDELYIGNTVWNRTSKSISNGKKKIRNPRSEWKITPNTHEAIISKEDYDKVQELLPVRNNRWPPGVRVATGPLFVCGNCGRALLKNTNKKSYICRTASLEHSDKCTICVDIDSLEACSLAYLQTVIDSFMSTKKNTASVNASKEEVLEKIETARRNQKNLSAKKLDYYTSYREGDMSREEFIKISDKIKKDIEEAEERIEALSQEYEELCKTMTDAAEESLQQIKQLQRFDKKLFKQVIDKIIVYGQDEIEVIWRMEDIFKSRFA